jgi:hypothetical protein
LLESHLDTALNRFSKVGWGACSMKGRDWSYSRSPRTVDVVGHQVSVPRCNRKC